MGDAVALSAEQVANLKAGQRIIFLDWNREAFFGREGNIIHYIHVGENYSALHGQANLGEYGDTWLAEINDGFFVETPEGMLHAYAVEDVERRSVAVELCRGDHDVPIQLARTSYEGCGDLSTRVWPNDWNSEGCVTVQHKGYNG